MTVNQLQSPSFGRLYVAASSAAARKAMAPYLEMVSSKKSMIGRLDSQDYDVMVCMRDYKQNSLLDPFAIVVEVCKKFNPLSKDKYSELFQLNENYSATKTFLKDKNIKEALNAFLTELESVVKK